MKLLLLGGTKFLGRHIVEAAQACGHEVTIFHRGQTNPELFPTIEKIHGDRAKDLALLEGRRWDAVIDTCGYFPDIVRTAAAFLADKVDHYTFISTISVYADSKAGEIDEEYPVGTLPAEAEGIEEVTGTSYGPLKALCEQAVEQVLPGRSLIIRPGLIVGPYDPTNRFTYWPHRIALGGEILTPDRKDLDVQIIDVRDLARWCVQMIEHKQAGVYNATGPERILTLQEVLERCKSSIESDAYFTWVSERFLEEHKVEPWTGLPLWIPKSGGTRLVVSIQKALKAGLTFHSLEETTRDTLAWDRAYPADPEKINSLSPAREVELLREWHEFSGDKRIQQ